MPGLDPDIHRMEDPESRLEQAIIDEFLEARGLDVAALRAMPDDERERTLRDASVYAGGKLAEVEARAHYVHEIHRQD